MALNWRWDEKIGSMKVDVLQDDDTWKEKEITLYNGNAVLIMLHEYKEGEDDMYDVFSFFVDKPHMNNMLGLTKGYENFFNSKYLKLKSISLDKQNCRYMWDIVRSFTKAFDNLTINFYTKESS